MGAQEKSQGNSNSLQRVKVYRLNEDGKWDDQGTGHVTVDYLERSEELALYVFDEEDNETLLVHRICPDDIYRKQEDTIISWRDSEYTTELALSFQENTGCSYIWDHICNVQRNIHFSSLNSETFHSMNSELRELPAVELSTLPIILKTVTESGIADQMRLTELILSDQDFFQKLMELFRICEDLENMDGLHMIFKIVKGIILLNSAQIFEKIFGEGLIMDIIGSLEYDPDVPQVQHYRNFLKEHVVFKEVISLLKDDSTFIQELFTRLRSPTTSAESKKNLVYFLREFCSLSKSLQMVQQLQLFRDLINEGIFDIISDALQSQDKKLVLTGTDILILFLNQDPTLLRSHVVRQEGIPLLGLLVKGMITDFGEDMHCQFLEILRSLLDSFSLTGAQRDTIIDIFYDKHLGQLIDVIILSCPSDEVGQSTSNLASSAGRVESQNNTKPEILLNICELLCFCVVHHPYRIKCNFLLNNVIDKILLLTRRREKYLVVAAVRFVRTILSRRVKKPSQPVIDAFVANGNRYNVLNSAVLELFEYIRKENVKLLVRYIVDSFWNQLVKFEYLASVQSLKVKYEQCLENCGTKANVNVLDSRKRIDERALEKEEEDYFNEDSEDDTSSESRTRKVQSQPVSSDGVAASYPSLSPRSGGLVDYEDDEDDEDYKPPPKKHTETSEDDEGTLETLRLKRKLISREHENEVAYKKQRLALCSTLSQAVLPSKKTTNAMPLSSQSAEGTKALPSDNRQLSGDDCPLVPPKSSPEMTVNGS
ncbi:hypothetical protein ERO13_D02G058450v2 [Gossypium hirsutum]|nr:hypothetical protein ERO13_D02G058450v2 [Gossypium hirsutum]